MKDKNNITLLILILLLGFSLRIYNLGSESFWIDEAATAYSTNKEVPKLINDIYTTTSEAKKYFEQGGTPPFYYVVANYWTGIIGLSEVRLRFLSVIFGIVSIYFIFLIGKLLFNYTTGLIAAFIISINSLHIYYSQEARSYSLGILLTLFTVYFLIVALKEKKIAYWIGYIISSSLLIYTHYFGIFILVFEYLFLCIPLLIQVLYHGVTLVFEYPYLSIFRRDLKRVFLSGLCIFILYIPWLPALYKMITIRNYLGVYFEKSMFYYFVIMFVQFNSWISLKMNNGIVLILTVCSISIITILMCSMFFISVFIKNKKLSIGNFKDNKLMFLLLWFVIPILIPMIISWVLPQSPIFGSVNYVIFASPAYYLIVSNGIFKSKKPLILLALLIVLSVFPLYSYYTNPDKQQWREAAKYLESSRKDYELVIVIKASNILPLDYYYGDMENIIGIKDIHELIDATDNQDSFWMVYSSEKYGDPKGELRGYVDYTFNVREEIEFKGIKVFHYLD